MKNTISDWFQLGSGRNEGFVKLPSLSCGNNDAGNTIVQGNNLDVLREIVKPGYGKIRCIYIDPPYNNREHYTHYDDDLTHDEWLTGITTRLEYLFELLTEDGSLWISIDDGGVHYLKVAADQVLQRKNFLTTIVWEQRTTRENRRAFSNNHEYILVYAKNPKLFRENRRKLDFTDDVISRYKNPDNDKRGPWQSVSVNVQYGHATKGQFYEVVSPTGKRHLPPKGRCWIYNNDRMQEEIKKKNIWFGKNGDGVPRLKVFLSQSQKGLTPNTLWPASEVGTSKDAKKHLLMMFPDEKIFDTPKPEQLIRRIFNIATNPGDIVLDAYLGSGTTAAVAHKMGRKYIGIEIGEHAITHCVNRLRLVTSGEEGGISKDVNWKGGGGFDFMKLQKQYKKG